MIASLPPGSTGNLRKHASGNPLQQWLISRFHDRVADFVRVGLMRCRDGWGTQPGTGDRATGPLVLDVGCGEGFGARAMTNRLPGVRVVGVDVRGDAVHRAAGNARPVVSGVRPQSEAGAASFLLGDACALPFGDRAAPVVMALEVLEHLEEPWRALEELQRVSSAFLVVSVPDQPLFALANLARGKNLVRLGEDREHLHHWRGSTLLGELRQRAEVTSSVRSFPWIIALVRR